MTDPRWIEGKEIKKVIEKIQENIVEAEIKLFQEKEVAAFVRSCEGARGVTSHRHLLKYLSDEVTRSLLIVGRECSMEWILRTETRCVRKTLVETADTDLALLTLLAFFSLPSPPSSPHTHTQTRSSFLILLCLSLSCGSLTSLALSSLAQRNLPD